MMTHNIDHTKFTIYKDISEKQLFVAVEHKYVSEIRKIVRIFGQAERVPETYTIPGIHLHRMGNNNYQPSGNQLKDIRIKNLQFDL
jgi:hypothetical protein